MKKERRLSNQRTIESIYGYLFAAPWILGFLIFALYPIGSSLYMCFTNYDMLNPAKFIGLLNFKTIFTKDPLFLKSIYNTLYYVVFSVPIGLVLSVAIAMLLNQDVKGIRLYRTIFYLPNVVSMVAVSLLWMWVLDPSFGILNNFLASIGIEGPGWLTDTKWSKPALILMSFWGVGGGTIMYLAALKGIPRSYYEAATIDGASAWKKTIKITIPMITPTIFYNLIMGVIGGLQVFGQSFVMTSGGPAKSTYFYGLHLYQKAFVERQMGYASALAWLLLVVTLLLALCIFKTSNKWVYYEVDSK